MSKKKIVLQFPTLHVLWSFAQTLTTNSMEVNTSNKTLTCDCFEDEIDLAVNKYNAVLIQDLQERFN
jgi:hypothetical protein